ncbi:hypothetical protein H4R19_005636 [Coemansia spiralis]|nr:hypothetical protein H4R19_005636 [Coemansia spiralis]
MKFTVAVAALATGAAAAGFNTMSEISSKWSAITSIINADLPVLRGANPAVYAQATSVIGGTAITQAFDAKLIQQVATGVSPALMNAVLSRAGVTGVTLDGKPIPTDDAGPAPETDTHASSPVTSAHDSSSDEKEESSASSKASSKSSSSKPSNTSASAKETASSDSKSEDKSESDKSVEEKSSSAAAVKVAGSLVAAVAVAAVALF